MHFFTPLKRSNLNEMIRAQLKNLTNQMDNLKPAHMDFYFDKNYNYRPGWFIPNCCQARHSEAIMLSQKYHFLKEVSELWNEGELTGSKIQALLSTYPHAYEGFFSTTKRIINLLSEDPLVNKDINLSEYKNSLST